MSSLMWYNKSINSMKIKDGYGLKLINSHSELDSESIKNYDAVVLALAHNEFKDLDITPKDNQVVYDIKSILKNADGRL